MKIMEILWAIGVAIATIAWWGVTYFIGYLALASQYGVDWLDSILATVNPANPFSVVVAMYSSKAGLISFFIFWWAILTAIGINRWMTYEWRQIFKSRTVPPFGVEVPIEPVDMFMGGRQPQDLKEEDYQ